MNPWRKLADALTGRELAAAQEQMKHDSKAAQEASRKLREASSKLDDSTTQLRERLHRLGELPGG